jgi:hypothetical protein
MGRTITPTDDATPGTGAVAVASFHFWQHTLSSDREILGRTITINGAPFEVIGVMPREFEGLKQGLEPADLWTPTTMQTVILQKPSMLTPASVKIHRFLLRGCASVEPPIGLFSSAQDHSEQIGED